VIAYAHQGGAIEAPASTLYAIERAVESGVPAVELDVHATADRRLVVCHDATLDRTTPVKGEITSRSLNELMDIDNSYWFGDDDGGYPFRGRATSDRRFGIATLEEVLERFPEVIFNLDIKRTAPEVEPYEELLAELLRSYGRKEDVIVASFNDGATDTFSSYAPEIPTSAGTAATVSFYRCVREGTAVPESVRRHVALQVPATYNGITVVDRDFVETAHKSGLAVHVWTVDDPAEMRQLIELGVDGVISDVPSVLMGVLTELGAAWRP
jgi:glycerophosphoryl diester phosphodiesterase